MDINGQPRPPTPGSGDPAPSPKRQRLEGSFNGAPIGPMGRGQPQPMPGQQVRVDHVFSMAEEQPLFEPC